jgi:DNA-binding transcriptional regulator YiaG
MKLDFRYGSRNARPSSGVRKPLFELKEIAEFLKVKHSLLVNRFAHYAGRPKPKIIAIPKRYYDKDEVAAWFKQTEEKVMQALIQERQRAERQSIRAERPTATQSDLSAARLRAERHKAKLTQAALSKLLGITQTSISQWEMLNVKHRTKPSSASLKALSEIFGVEIDYLKATDWEKNT